MSKSSYTHASNTDSVSELATIPVPGTDGGLMGALVDGTPSAALKPMCDLLDVDYSTQLRKLKGKSWATVGLMPMVAADGKQREMAMIDRRTMTMWLATIDENRVKPEAKPILIAFQAEAADALDAYFNQGGAINPRATEDQLDRIARQAQAQAAVLQALKGVVDPKHLEAKGRIILARALGEAPEIAPADVPLYVWDYLTGKGMPRDLVQAKASGFGRRLKALYCSEYDRAPELHMQNMPDGKVREICSYTEADRPLFDAVWARHYANVVAFPGNPA